MSWNERVNHIYSSLGFYCVVCPLRSACLNALLSDMYIYLGQSYVLLVRAEVYVKGQISHNYQCISVLVS